MWNLPALRNSSSLASPLFFDRSILRTLLLLLLRYPRAVLGAIAGPLSSWPDYVIDFQSVVSELRNRSGRILLHET